MKRRMIGNLKMIKRYVYTKLFKYTIKYNIRL